MNIMEYLAIAVIGSILVLIMVILLAFYMWAMRQICCIPRRYKSKRCTCPRDSTPLTNVTHIPSQASEIEECISTRLDQKMDNSSDQT